MSKRELEELELRCLKMEEESKQLEDNFESLKRYKLAEDRPDIQALKAENAKLEYRINILKQYIEELDNESVEVSSSDSLINILDRILLTAIAKAYPSVSLKSATIVPGSKNFGHYQSNCVMNIAKIVKSKGPIVAQSIVNHIEKGNIIDSLSVAGPGFINVNIKASFISSSITKMLVEGIRPPPVKKQKVVIDFSSPNVAKEMHVGHLRSTIIGESISRLLEFVGHDVLRLNHIGDWGTQFGMLIAHLEDKFPNYLNESPPIQNLQEFYKESKKRFDEDEEFKKRAYSCVVKLQNYETNIMKAWKLICDVSRKEIQIIYDRLDVTLIERGESFYQEKMKELIPALKMEAERLGGGEYFEEGGRWSFFCKGMPLPLTVVKSDGGFTYDTSDLAAIKQRVEEEHADWVIYVVDIGQAIHFECIFKAARHLGWVKPSTRIDHVEFGVVLGEDKKKFKTRSGDTVKLSALLDEGLQRSLDKLKAKERDKVLTKQELEAAMSSVAYGCIKYADLCHSRTNDYIFSFDRMLDDKGNTAVYLLYSLTRIKSIARNAGVDKEALAKAATNTDIVLEHPKEIALGLKILKFSEIILAIIDDLFLHKLCEYLFELSSVFTEFYDNCYCITKNTNTGEIESVNMSRLLLCEATDKVMTQGFYILGIKPVERM